MTAPKSLNLASTYVRLRSNASVEPLPVDSHFWRHLAEGRFGTFENEYLVTSHTFDSVWSQWEMHPKGDEIVCLIAGSATFILETGDEPEFAELNEPGAFVVVRKGTWHTAQANPTATMLFITAGEGTQHRERR